MMFLTLAAALVSPQAVQGQSSYSEAQAERDLRSTITAFGDAITSKDSAKFLSLFADGPVTWRRVNSDARLSKAGGSSAKAGFDPANTPRVFIERIVQSPNRHEETFSNIRIDNDLDVAAITFDFTYRVNGRPINVGKESWHLVRAERGWRIVSVIYSNNGPRY